MPDSGKKADWTYRVVNFALSAAIAYGVGWVANKLDTFSSLPSQIRQLVSDQAVLKTSVERVENTQAEMKKTQEGFATDADVKELRSDVDTLKGHVGALQEQVNGISGRRTTK